MSGVLRTFRKVIFNGTCISSTSNLISSPMANKERSSVLKFISRKIYADVNTSRKMDGEFFALYDDEETGMPNPKTAFSLE
jgi:hypothetical protein